MVAWVNGNEKAKATHFMPFEDAEEPEQVNEDVMSYVDRINNG